MSTSASRGLTIDEKVLLSAATLPTSGFTAEELEVATFKRFPDDFHLAGFPEYPDSNRILTQITTAGRGLQKRGWLRQIGTKRYQLTAEGRRRLEALRPDSEDRGSRTDNRDIAEMLLHWLRSDAFRKHSSGKKDEIAERDALVYWRLTAGASAVRTHRMLATAESAVKILEENIGAGQPSRLQHDRAISPHEGQQLIALHQYLRKRFASALEFLQGQRH